MAHLAVETHQRAEPSFTVGNFLNDAIGEAPRSQRAHDRELAHANRVALIGQLSASIAHEVAQPITGIVISAQVALRRLSVQQANVEEIRQALGRIVRDGKRAADIIGSIRALVRKAPPSTGLLNVSEAIVEVLGLTHGDIVKQGISIETQFANDLPPIRGDRVQLQQVMLNLIMNAIEAMRACTERSRHLVIRTARTKSDGVLVVVRDSGPGLGPEDLDRVFDAFYTTKPEGLGMGLAICRSLIRAHGGRLWATSGAQRGAVFQFTLPGSPAAVA